MKKNKILLAVFVIFMVIVLLITYDMSSRTTKPWNKKKRSEEKK